MVQDMRNRIIICCRGRLARPKLHFVRTPSLSTALSAANEKCDSRQKSLRLSRPSPLIRRPVRLLMNIVLLHLERLHRHYGVAVRTNDQVSLFDLSHTLRVWTELKKPLEKIAPKFSTAISFKTAIPARKVLKAAHGHRYVFSYMPDGVITYASKGHLASGPGMGPDDGDFALGVAVKLSPPSIELGKFSFVSRSFEQPLIKALDAETVTCCTFTQWLGAEAVRVAHLNQRRSYEVVTISREMIVKRIANTLDGSHPSATGGNDGDNKFDEPIHYLLQYQVGGLPLPYFILLKIAQDLLAVAPKLLGTNDAERST